MLVIQSWALPVAFTPIALYAVITYVGIGVGVGNKVGVGVGVEVGGQDWG